MYTVDEKKEFFSCVTHGITRGAFSHIFEPEAPGAHPVSLDVVQLGINCVGTDFSGDWIGGVGEGLTVGGNVYLVRLVRMFSAKCPKILCLIAALRGPTLYIHFQQNGKTL